MNEQKGTWLSRRMNGNMHESKIKINEFED